MKKSFKCFAIIFFCFNTTYSQTKDSIIVKKETSLRSAQDSSLIVVMKQAQSSLPLNKKESKKKINRRIF